MVVRTEVILRNWSKFCDDKCGREVTLIKVLVNAVADNLWPKLSREKIELQEGCG